MFTTLTPRQVVDNFWIRGNIPINPHDIARNAGVSIKALAQEDRQAGVSGYYISGSSPTILYNPDEPLQRIRFTIAHELGHHFLGHGTRPRDTTRAFTLYNSDPIESEANAFAAELLMPKDYVKALYLRGGIRTIEELASQFNVSKLAMKIRLQNLGYLPQ